ncbi:5'/3'-nucleotidase SurE [Stigmatella aurantiaca]|uniref:5'-nucleotidase SurE n=1 Tax=Stigmatella aurantiaca (strain DW4/3-1) TaxID=378806 RepID=Q08W51_STIAD|nr:5'/3'-nucleotidase SurE [Stigmatella aurantiaca]ADO73558.1 5'-nucleotidase SurE [Stigmatella aurantiaca DW4/3-1]EAU64708.1 5'-nucleotidase SurE [Stigmatella aurantiaca DW4/3-1]
MRILLCNDDGFLAEGLRTLASELTQHGHDVTIVAPSAERSGQSHAMTFFEPLLVRHVSHQVYAVHGTPADSAFIGLRGVLGKTPPDLFIAGINHGLNVGIDVNYSGTIGAATEASLLGFRAMAISMDVDPFKGQPGERTQAFQRTARLAAELIGHLHRLDWAPQEMLSLNHPGHEPRGLVAAHCHPDCIYVPHLEHLASRTHSREDLQVYVIGGTTRATPQDGEHDVAALQAGYATLSFLQTHQGHTPGTSRLRPFLDMLRSA